MVVQKNISVQSHCEHHMAPIIGVAHVAYIPKDRVVGLNKEGQSFEDDSEDEDCDDFDQEGYDAFWEF